MKSDKIIIFWCCFCLWFLLVYGVHIPLFLLVAMTPHPKLIFHLECPTSVRLLALSANRQRWHWTLASFQGSHLESFAYSPDPCQTRSIASPSNIDELSSISVAKIAEQQQKFHLSMESHRRQLSTGCDNRSENFVLTIKDLIFENIFWFSVEYFKWTYRKHAFAFAQYQHWNICIVIDIVKFEIDIELLFAYQVANMHYCFNALALQFSRF